jgi:hypothetical protein
MTHSVQKKASRHCYISKPAWPWMRLEAAGSGCPTPSHAPDKGLGQASTSWNRTRQPLLQPSQGVPCCESHRLHQASPPGHHLLHSQQYALVYTQAQD